jgi:hypothetical protein
MFFVIFFHFSSKKKTTFRAAVAAGFILYYFVGGWNCREQNKNNIKPAIERLKGIYTFHAFHINIFEDEFLFFREYR